MAVNTKDRGTRSLNLVLAFVDSKSSLLIDDIVDDMIIITGAESNNRLIKEDARGV